MSNWDISNKMVMIFHGMIPLEGATCDVGLSAKHSSRGVSVIQLRVDLWGKRNG